MDRAKGELMSKNTFLNNVSYTKEPYKGILVSADTMTNQYKIAVQVSETQVLMVDQVSDQEVLGRVEEWVPHINSIQVQYRGMDDPQSPVF
ncbi:MAG TPA: hypothetical protein VFC84_20245 [Desulfosporosinus sp.]|nr:hypothetical protein [Desulfosporosinus sp.]